MSTTTVNMAQPMPTPTVNDKTSDADPTGEIGAAPKEEEYQEDLNAIMICPDCQINPPNLIEEFSSGDVVCKDCGVVLGDRIIDTRSEWRTFANDEAGNDDPSRVGEAANALLNGAQLETTIAFGEGGRARDLHRTHNRSQQFDKSNKGLLQAYKEITDFCESSQIAKSVQDSAKHIFKLTDDKKVFKSKPQEAIIAGCIFIACRQAKAPRTFKEIFNLTNVSKKEIGRTFKLLEKFLQNNKEVGKGSSVSTKYEGSGSTSAAELCGRYCNDLGFRDSHRMEMTSRALAERSCQIVADLAGRSPLSVAAACIYMTSHLMGDGRSTKAIALIAGVSDGTIKTAYRFLLNARDDLIDPNWLPPKGGGDVSRLPAS